MQTLGQKRALGTKNVFLSCQEDLWLLTVKAWAQWNHYGQDKESVHSEQIECWVASRVEGIPPSGLNTNRAQSCLAAMEKKKQDMHTVIDVGLTRKSWRPGSLRYMTSSVGRICSQEGFSGTSVNPQAQFTTPAQSPSPVSIDNHSCVASTLPQQHVTGVTKTPRLPAQGAFKSLPSSLPRLRRNQPQKNPFFGHPCTSGCTLPPAPGN